MKEAHLVRIKRKGAKTYADVTLFQRTATVLETIVNQDREEPVTLYRVTLPSRAHPKKQIVRTFTEDEVTVLEWKGVDIDNQ